MYNVEDALKGLEEPEYVQNLRDALRNAQRQLAASKQSKAEYVQLVQRAAMEATLSQGPIPPVPAWTNTTSDHKQEVALIVTSDWQRSKVTTSYDSEICDRRVKQFFEKCVELTARHRHQSDVQDACVVFGGDLLEGIMIFPGQPFEVDATLFEQWISTSKLIIDVVRMTLANFRNVHVCFEWGNHGRAGDKRSHIPKKDNYDRLCGAFAHEVLMQDPSIAGRLTWQMSEDDQQLLEIGAYRAVVMHGDEIGRGGFSSPATLVRHADRWASGALRRDGEPWKFRDVYTHHLHQHQEWNMANGLGTVFMTGSTESDNRYAMDTMAASAVPSQRLHFVDPVKGRVTAQYKVWLD